MVKTILQALTRARGPILVVAATYFITVFAGMVMVHTGNIFALSYRDDLVGRAQSDSVLTQESPLQMALADFRGNLIGASADALGGLGVVFPFPLIAYRGWVGGIVSVNGEHVSRLLQPASAVYYLSVVLLQLTGYSLAAGAGLNAGLSMWRPRPEYSGKKWLGIPREALLDLARIYVLVVPILLIASLWEFLSPW